VRELELGRERHVARSLREDERSLSRAKEHKRRQVATARDQIEMREPIPSRDHRRPQQLEVHGSLSGTNQLMLRLGLETAEGEEPTERTVQRDTGQL